MWNIITFPASNTCIDWPSGVGGKNLDNILLVWLQRLEKPLMCLTSWQEISGPLMRGAMYPNTMASKEVGLKKTPRILFLKPYIFENTCNVKWCCSLIMQVFLHELNFWQELNCVPNICSCAVVKDKLIEPLPISEEKILITQFVR